MRVVSGVLGGRLLKGPPDDRARPTSDRVRESIFNSLASRQAIDGARVLDLFAGTGAMGIEALSRGAEHVTFVEVDPTMVVILRDNVAQLDLADRCLIVGCDADRALGDLRGRDFDLVLLDPPYGFDRWPELLEALPGTRAVIESDRPVALPAMWDAVREKRHGGTLVTIVERAAPVRGRAMDGDVRGDRGTDQPTMDETARGDQ